MFYRTSREDKHSHVLYWEANMGPGVTSVDRGHSHQIVNGGDAPIFVPALDGHTHTLASEIAVKEDSGKKKSEGIVKECRSLWKYAKELENDFRKRGEESEGFYAGDPKVIWKGPNGEDVKSKLEKDDRPALNFNEIEGKVDLLSGYQRQNRFDIKYFPVEDGDARVADIITNVVKNIWEQCNADYEETKVFEDELIPGRGTFHAYIDYDSNIRGDIKVERFPWVDVWIGPHEKEDLSDCEHLHKGRWFSKGKIKQQWPEKADEIDVWTSALDGLKHTTKYEGDNYEHPDSDNEGLGVDADFVNIARKEIRVIETIRKEYSRVTVLANTELDAYVTSKGWDSKDIEAVKTIPGFKAIPRNVTKFRTITWAGSVLLEDVVSDIDEFMIVPVYAKKRGSRVWGKIESAKDPQREINKRRSQGADILNRVAGYGWFYDDQTFADPKLERKFKENAGSVGFTIKVNDVGRPPIKTEGAKFPGELVNFISLDSIKIREIMNVNLEMQGGTGNATSGIAIAERKRTGLVGNEFLFDNLSLAKRMLGRIILKLIQKTYTPERIIRLLHNRAQKSEVKIGGTPWEEIDKNEIFRLLSDQDLSRYDVVVGESAASPTQKLANFAMFAELASQGVPLPPDMLIKLSPLPEVEKQEALVSLQQQQAVQAQAEKAKYDTEIQKTVIAKGMPEQAVPMPGMQTGTPYI